MMGVGRGKVKSEAKGEEEDNEAEEQKLEGRKVKVDLKVRVIFMERVKVTSQASRSYEKGTTWKALSAWKYLFRLEQRCLFLFDKQCSYSLSWFSSNLHLLIFFDLFPHSLVLLVLFLLIISRMVFSHQDHRGFFVMIIIKQ